MPDLRPTGSKKRKAIVKESKLPFNGRQAQSWLSKKEMLERIEKMKREKEEK